MVAVSIVTKKKQEGEQKPDKAPLPWTWTWTWTVLCRGRKERHKKLRWERRNWTGWTDSQKAEREKKLSSLPY